MLKTPRAVHLIPIFALVAQSAWAADAAKPSAQAKAAPTAQPSSTAAKTQSLPVSGGSVDFIAVGRPSAIKIHGHGSAPTGKIEVDGTSVKGDIAFELKTLDTGIDLRTNHMKEKYLETGKYPTAQFRITKMQLPAPLNTPTLSARGIPFEGELTLHGKTQPITGQTDLKSDGSKLNALAKFTAKITDHGIDVPKYMGITVADQVDVAVDLQVTR